MFFHKKKKEKLNLIKIKKYNVANIVKFKKIPFLFKNYIKNKFL